MKPLHPVIEERMAALELDIATGKFKNADGLRAADPADRRLYGNINDRCTSSTHGV